MMETRRAKLRVDMRKKGTGGTTFRATLPSKWIREMGLDEITRDLKLTFDGEIIIIERNIEDEINNG